MQENKGGRRRGEMSLTHWLSGSVHSVLHYLDTLAASLGVFLALIGVEIESSRLLASRGSLSIGRVIHQPLLDIGSYRSESLNDINVRLRRGLEKFDV
jgi:hypothetical protein